VQKVFYSTISKHFAGINVVNPNDRAVGKPRHMDELVFKSRSKMKDKTHASPVHSTLHNTLWSSLHEQRRIRFDVFISTEQLVSADQRR